MNSNNEHKALVNNIRDVLNAGLDEIDAATQSKITRARHRALDLQARKHRFQFWLPISTVATACILVMAISLFPLTVVEEDPLPIDDLELISNLDDLELLEDLEFYEWLEDYELPT